MRVEAQRHALFLCVSAERVRNGTDFIEHLGVCRALQRTAVTEIPAVLAVVPLAADGCEKIDLLFADLDVFFHVGAKVTVQVHKLHAAALFHLDELVRVFKIIADKGEVFHIVIAEELAFLKRLLQLLFGGLSVLGSQPSPTCICCFHNRIASMSVV